MSKIDVQETIDRITAGISGAGLATSQDQYELNYKQVFNGLDELEEYLGDNRFLSGNSIGDEDKTLYDVLVRFDSAYYFGYRFNQKRIRDYDNLWNYAKELYSIQTFKEATDFEAIKREYLLGEEINPHNILPNGPDNSIWGEPNNRTEIFGPINYSN